MADRLAMLQYSVFSVISPEGCAAILWNDGSKIESATKSLKIIPEYLKEAGLIDDVIMEPLIGAHRDKLGTAKAISNYFVKSLEEIRQNKDFVSSRYQKIISYGNFA